MLSVSEPKNVEINGEFETSAVTIQANAEAFKTLSEDLYTYLERAVVREYSCNAWDAHQDAEVERPFEVHLPTSLEAWFSVRDFGFGLDDHDIRNVFAGYFNSSKRDTNNQVGFFGLGSKSALSLSDSFTVTSYHGGFKTVFSIYKDEEGKPHVAKLTQEESDETGIEVKVNTGDRAQEFKREAFNVFKYWEILPKINSDDVLEDIKEWQESLELVSDSYAFQRKAGRTKAVMGNVAYDIPSEYDILGIEGYVRFDIGELNMAPSREQLSANKKTQENLQARLSLIKEALGTDLRDEIELEATDFLKAQKYDRLNKGVFSGVMQLSANRDMFSKYRLAKSTTPIVYFKQKDWGSAVKKDETFVFPMGDKVEYYAEKSGMTGRIRLRCKDYGKITIVLLTPEQIAEYNVPSDLIWDLEDLEKPERMSSGSRAVCKIRVFTLNLDNNRCSKPRDCWSTSDLDINSPEEKVYIEICRFEDVNGRENNYLVQDIKKLRDHGVEIPEVYGVKSSLVKTKKFGNSNFIGFREYMEREVAKIAPVNPKQYTGGNAYGIQRLADDHQLFEELNDAIQSCVSDVDTYFFGKYGIKVTIDTSVDTLAENTMKEYPLLPKLLNNFKTAEVAEILKAMDFKKESTSNLLLVGV